MWKLCYLASYVFFLNPRNKESVYIIFWWSLILKWMHIQSFNYPVRPECHLHKNVKRHGCISWLVWLAELMFDWLLSRLLTHGPSLSCCESGCWTVHVHLSIAITTLILLQLDFFFIFLNMRGVLVCVNITAVMPFYCPPSKLCKSDLKSLILET